MQYFHMLLCGINSLNKFNVPKGRFAVPRKDMSSLTTVSVNLASCLINGHKTQKEEAL